MRKCCGSLSLFIWLTGARVDGCFYVVLEALWQIRYVQVERFYNFRDKSFMYIRLYLQQKRGKTKEVLYNLRQSLNFN